MKITTQVPEPLPVMWTLEFTDDEMAELVSVIDHSPQGDRVASQMVRYVPNGTWGRLLARGARLATKVH